MSTTEQERERYGAIVLRYLTGDYTMDPDDAGDVAEAVIAAYVEDQAARQAAMEHKLIEIEQALIPVTGEDGVLYYEASDDIMDVIDDAQAILLDATEQEAGMSERQQVDAALVRIGQASGATSIHINHGDEIDDSFSPLPIVEDRPICWRCNGTGAHDDDTLGYPMVCQVCGGDGRVTEQEARDGARVATHHLP